MATARVHVELQPLVRVHDGVDGASLYMNPGQSGTTVDLWVTLFGEPAESEPVSLELVPSPLPAGFDDNQPASALSFPSTVTTGAGGSASIAFEASNPSPLPAGRQNIGGQLYYIGGPWASGNVWNADNSGVFFAAPLSVKLFNSIDPPITSPTWNDVQPILYKYYYLYGYMASIVDLSNYAAVKAKASALQSVLSLSPDDPSYMPVTREMSSDQQQLILNWIANGCPPGSLVRREKERAALRPPLPNCGVPGYDLEDGAVVASGAEAGFEVVFRGRLFSFCRMSSPYGRSSAPSFCPARRWAMAPASLSRLGSSFRSSESEFPSSKSEFPNSKSEFPSFESEFPNSKSEFPNSKSEFPSFESEFPNSESEFPNSKSELPNSKSELPNSKSELPSSRATLRNVDPTPRRTKVCPSTAAPQPPTGRNLQPQTSNP